MKNHFIEIGFTGSIVSFSLLLFILAIPEASLGISLMEALVSTGIVSFLSVSCFIASIATSLREMTKK